MPSGAGRSPSLTTLYCAVSESFKAYKTTGHRHNPEMEEVLGREAGQAVTLTFVPHLVPMSRGMQTTIYANPAALELFEARGALPVQGVQFHLPRSGGIRGGVALALAIKIYRQYGTLEEDEIALRIKEP